MTKSEFIEWLQTATFKRTSDSDIDTIGSIHEYTDDEGVDHFRTEGMGFVWNTVGATLPDGSSFYVSYQEAINWSGTATERYGDYDSEPANEDIVWNERRPTVTEDDDPDEDLDEWDIDELVKEHLPGLTDINYEALIPDLTTEDIDLESDMEEFELDRDNAPNLKFRGEKIASVSSSDNNASGSYSGSTGRWTTLRLYKTAGGKFVCNTIGHTRWQGEQRRDAASVCATEAEVIQYFGHGWLAKELYVDAGIEDVESVD